MSQGRAAFLQVYQKCAPSTSLSDGTCFMREELMCIAEAAGKLLGMELAHSDIAAMTNEEILLHIDDFLQANAVQSNKWLEAPKLMRSIERTCPKLADTILKYRLAPAYTNPGEPGWTTDGQLERVMMQFLYALRREKRPLHFEGAYNNKPMEALCSNNYQCTSPIQSHFSDPSNAKTPWSIILNTSYHGTHWVAVYVEKAGAPIEYFDSFGNAIPISLTPALKWLRRGLDVPIYRLSRRHQYDDYSCGPFSVFYIVYRRRGVPMKYFESNSISKEQINTFRASLFDIDPPSA